MGFRLLYRRERKVVLTVALCRYFSFCVRVCVNFLSALLIQLSRVNFRFLSLIDFSFLFLFRRWFTLFLKVCLCFLQCWISLVRASIFCYYCLFFCCDGGREGDRRTNIHQEKIRRRASRPVKELKVNATSNQRKKKQERVERGHEKGYEA